MATIKINLPDELIQPAEEAGLLTDAAIAKLINASLRRKAAIRILQLSEKLKQANIPRIDEEKLVAEIHAIRQKSHR